MKKLLNISVIAALAVLPFAANAAVTDADPGATINQTTEEGQTAAANATATNAPKYALAAAESNDGNVATAGYVKGAYNAAIKAVNKVADMATSATNSANISYDGTDAGLSATNVQDAIDELADEKADAAYTNANMSATTLAEAITELESEKLDASEADVAADGNYISAGTDVAANLGALDTAVQANEDAIDVLNGDASTTGSVAKQIADAITDLGMDNYATQDGVETTVTNALDSVTVKYDLSGLGVSTGAVTGTANAAITVMDTWGSNTAASQTISAPVDLRSTVAVTGLTGNSSNQSATVAHGTVAYPEPANP